MRLMPDLKQRFSEGGVKAVVLGAGAILVTGAAEAYRMGSVQEALGLGALAAVAFLIHEALTQYRFAFADDFKEFVAANVDGIEPPDDTAKNDDAD